MNHEIRTLKRLFCATLSALFLCGMLTGCHSRTRGSEGPEGTVEKFCQAMQSLNFDAMTPLMSNPDNDMIGVLKNSVSNQSQIIDLLQLCAKKIGFKITTSSPLSNGAEDMMKVSVEFSYPDLYAIIQDYIRTNSISLDEAITDTLKKTVRDVINWAYNRPLEISPRKKAPDFISWTSETLRKGNYTAIHVIIDFECVQGESGWSISFIPEDSLLQMLAFGLEV